MAPYEAALYASFVALRLLRTCESHYLIEEWLTGSYFAYACAGTREEEDDGRAAGCSRGCAGAWQMRREGTQAGKTKKWNEMRRAEIKKKKEITERES